MGVETLGGLRARLLEGPVGDFLPVRLRRRLAGDDPVARRRLVEGALEALASGRGALEAMDGADPASLRPSGWTAIRDLERAGLVLDPLLCKRLIARCLDPPACDRASALSPALEQRVWARAATSLTSLTEGHLVMLVEGIAARSDRFYGEGVGPRLMPTLEAIVRHEAAGAALARTLSTHCPTGGGGRSGGGRFGDDVYDLLTSTVAGPRSRHERAGTVEGGVRWEVGEASVREALAASGHPYVLEALVEAAQGAGDRPWLFGRLVAVDPYRAAHLIRRDEHLPAALARSDLRTLLTSEDVELRRAALGALGEAGDGAPSAPARSRGGG